MKRNRPKGKLRQLRLVELSLVDHPANPAAQVVLFKSEDGSGEAHPSKVAKIMGSEKLVESIAKRYLDPMDGAVSFSEVLQSRMAEDRYYAAQEEIGPLICSLDTALRSIVGDDSLTTEGKSAKVQQATAEFLGSIRDKWPDVEDALSKEFAGVAGDRTSREGDSDMPGDTKKLADLENQIAELTEKLETVTAASEDASKVAEIQEQLATATKQLEAVQAELTKAQAERDEAQAKASLSADEKAHYESLDEEERKKFLALDAKAREKVMTKAIADDETLTVEGRPVRKSVVGEDVFAVFKAQQERIATQDEAIAKERTRREDLEFAKQAEEQLSHLPGETSAKANALREIAKLDEAVQKTISTLLAAGEKLAASAFNTIGHDGDLKKTAGDFETKVSKIATEESCSKNDAMSRARERFPDEYEAYQEAGRVAAASAH